MLATLDTILAFVSVMLLLSMLVTVLVQMVNTALQRRGRNLEWALESFLCGVGLEAAEAKPLSCALLEHANVTDTGARKAEALDPKTLLLLLEDLGTVGGKALAKKSKAETGLSGDRGLAAIAQDALAELRALAGSTDDKSAGAEVLLQQALEGKDRLLRRFHMTMATATARFIRHTKWVAFGSALLLCGAFQIDSFSLFQELQQKDELRAAFVTAAESRIAETESRLVEIKASVNLAERAVDDVLAEREEEEGAEVAALRTRLRAERAALPAPSEPWLEDQWVAWVQRRAGPNEAVAAMQLVVAYRTHLDGLLAGAEEKLYAAATASLDRLLGQKTILRPPARWREWTLWRALGVIVTAVLVSLGAPFWFNVLGNLVNLRPVLAKTLQQLEAAESKPQKQAAGGSGA